MTGSGRFVVLGLAVARSPWFRSVSQWSNSASIPVEFVKCMSTTELRAHLASRRPFSALLVDAAAPGLDRDLLDDARSAGAAVIVVDSVRVTRDWIGLGASATINPLFDRTDLVEVLSQHTSRVRRGDSLPGDGGLWPGPDEAEASGGAAVAMVCGAGGTGASTAAIALAQGLADAPRVSGRVLLADLALHAEQAMLHDVRDIVPGIQELVEAHRTGRTPENLHEFTYEITERGYDLLLGLRRASNWSALRPRALAAGFESLVQRWQAVVCDTDADFEGEAEGGSPDVEERNAMARTAAARADAVLVVALPSMKGLHSLVRVTTAVLDHGVPGERVVPVLNRAPRSPRARADLARAIAALLQVRPSAAAVPTPVFLPERPVDELLRDGVRLPSALTLPLTNAFLTVVGRAGARAGAPAPRPVAAGSLGSWGGDVAGRAP